MRPQKQAKSILTKNLNLEAAHGFFRGALPLRAFNSESVIGPVAIAALKASSIESGINESGFKSLVFRNLPDDPLFG